MFVKYDSSSTYVPSQVKKVRFKMAARRKMITKKTGAISKVICLDLPALDEDYDQDTMIFLQAQRIFEVKSS